MAFELRLLLAIPVVACLLAAPRGALAQESIVGTWVGETTQGDSKFETRLTLVSPKGGVSRYPSFPCGGTLTGDRKGEAYEFNEVITWGGTDERSGGCIGGVVKITVDGDKMQYHWATMYNGQEYTAAGELRRIGKKR